MGYALIRTKVKDLLTFGKTLLEEYLLRQDFVLAKSPVFLSVGYPAIDESQDWRFWGPVFKLLQCGLDVC